MVKVFSYSIVITLVMFCSLEVMGFQVSAEFADPKTRMKSILVLPLATETFSVSIGGKTTLRSELTKEYSEQLFNFVTTDLKSKGYQLVFMEEADLNKELLESIRDEVLEMIQGDYQKNPKGVRFNWYKVRQGILELREKYKVDGIAFQHLQGGYIATEPSAARLVGTAALAIVGGSFSRQKIGSVAVARDIIRSRLVLIDATSGTLDLVSEAESPFSLTMRRNKEGEPDLSKSKKDWLWRLDKMVEKLPAVEEKAKVRISRKSKDMRPREPLTNDIDEKLLEDIEDLLAE